MNTFTDDKQPIIIAVDHGYGNTKTSHYCFRSGVTVHDTEPFIKNDMLTYEGKYYVIGDEHLEFVADKTENQDYYILTLVAVAKELRYRNLTTAQVYLATGLPLTWVGEQRDAFKAYLLQNDVVDFTYRNMNYHVEFVGADVFAQGIAAVAMELRNFRGVNMLCDIGNGTMNIMFINNGRPISTKCFTEKYGTHQCMLAVREQLLRKYGTIVEDDVIEEVLRTGTADISQKYLDAISESASEYVSGIMRRLREHEYNPELMKLYVMGGGSCLVKNFGSYDPERVTINTDICATAKGYEALARYNLQKRKAGAAQ